MKQNSENPFWGIYQTPFGTPPFDQIKTEQIGRASCRERV